MLLRSSVSLSTPHDGRPAAGETSGSARSLSKQPSLGIVLLQMLDFALCCVCCVGSTICVSVLQVRRAPVIPMLPSEVSRPGAGERRVLYRP